MAIETFQSSIRLPVAPTPVRQPTTDLSGVVNAANQAVSLAVQDGREKRQAALADARFRAIKELAPLAQQFEDARDPEAVKGAFDGHAEELRAEIARGIDGEDAQQAFDADFREMQLRHGLALQDRARRNRTTFERGALDNRLDELLGEVAAEKDSNVRDGIIDTGIDMIGGVATGGWIDLPTAEKLGRQFKARAADATVTELVVDDPRAALAALSDKEQFTDLDPDRRNILKDRAARRAEDLDTRDRLERERAAEKVRRQHRADLIEVAQRAELAARMALSGERHEAEADILSAAATATTFGDPELADAAERARAAAISLQTARGARDLGPGFAAETPAAQARVIGEMSARGIESTTDLAVLSDLRRIHETTKREVQQDFVGHLLKQGIVTEGVSFASVESWTMRAQAVNANARAFGVASPGILDKAEAEDLARSWTSADTTGRADMLEAMTVGLGRDGTQAVMRQVAGVAGARRLAATGFIAAEAPHLREDLLAGEDVRTSVEGVMPERADIATAATEAWGDAFRGQAPAMQAYTDAGINLYLARRQRAGTLNGPPDPSALEQAFLDVSGPVDRRNGHDFFLPRGWTPDRFDDLLGRIEDGDLKGWFAGDVPMTADLLADAGTFEGIGPGRYLVGVRGRGFVTNGLGDPFILEAERMDETISGRSAPGPSESAARQLIDRMKAEGASRDQIRDALRELQQ